MKFRVLLCLCVLLMFFACVYPCFAHPRVVDDINESVKSVNTFALKIAPFFNAGKGGFFFFPYSILSALGMSGAGASGQTKADMYQALSMTDAFHNSFGKLTNQLKTTMSGKNGTPTFANANCIWFANDLNLNPEYIEIVKKGYDTAMAMVNFRESENVRVAINNWVEKQTRGRIKDLIQHLNTDVRMVLTNAVYFKGMWKEPFPLDNMELESVYRSVNRDIGVARLPMMKQTAEFKYAELDEVRLVRIPYVGGADMLIILPSGKGDKRVDDILTMLRRSRSQCRNE